MRLIQQLALIIILICLSTLISFVDILIEFCLSEHFPTLTGVSLTILAVLFTCIYTKRTSAEDNMHNANANFAANETDKRIREIWLEDSFKWRSFCASNTKIATMFLYSFALLAIMFFIILIVPFIKISPKLIVFCIAFLTLWSIINLLRGFWCYGKSGSKLYKSYLFSWDSVPGDDNEKLVRFLRDDFDIDWAEDAGISKSTDSTSIIISNDEHLAKIIIDEKEEKATIEISDGRTHELKIKEENSKLNIYNKSKEESCLTKVSHRLFKTDLLSYECSPRFSVFNEWAEEIYHEYETNYIRKRKAVRGSLK